jgi:type I restriction-modification system DNA methylase subunit
MNRDQARILISQTFTRAFDKGRFLNFTRNLVNHLDESKAFARNSQYVKDAFKDHVARFERLGTYTSAKNEKLDVLIVHLTEEWKLERARTAIRNFVADHLKMRDEKDAALVAFVSPTEKQWRFSYVKMEYAAVEHESGKVAVETRLTPARRFSYIVGEGESCHTAQTRFVDLLQETGIDPALTSIEEAFSVEAVTKEFFKKYADLFGEIHRALEQLVAKDKTIRDEFNEKNVNAVEFAKKLMGQIVFLHFLQKKGWLGVAKGEDWGSGPHDFLRRLEKGEYGKYSNFFNDVLEPLFYDTLATDRGHEAWCNRFKCRIPFLNGGLFEPLGNYDWRKTDITLPNSLFSNSERVEEGITGSGVLDAFDRYNFTVNEAEPLEKEVAIDPEMLGKVFENLIEENLRKGLGAHYTPREIVHYMCQESLINYLDVTLNKDVKSVARAEIEDFVHLGDQAALYEAARLSGTKTYAVHLPKSIETHARMIDEKLAGITICDPAVGSGAFPVGMMTEIVRARSALTPYFNDFHERTPYHFKRHAIQNCLYGVDIDAGAVEIAKLRLWLSLVVDEEDVKQIKPLPNLDYKIVIGNSLLGFPFKSQRIQAIEKLKEDFFNEGDHVAKALLKRQIDEKLDESVAASKKSLGYVVTFDFETWFSEIFRKQGGFDVVIANPPYVDSETMVHNDPKGRELIASLFATTRGNWDLYIPFWELGLKKINKTGTAAFITPNKWLSISYGKGLREHSTPYIYHLADYSKFRAFESVGVFPIVMLMSKSRPLNLTVRRFMENQCLVYEQSMPVNSLENFKNWGVFLSPHLPLIQKLAFSCPKLSTLCNPEEPFTVSEAYEIAKLIEEWTTSKKEFMKFVNTGTIDPYVSLWGLKQTTYIKAKYSKPVVDATRFHRLFPRRYDQSTRPKIIISGIRHFESFLDKQGEYVAGKSTVILRNFRENCSAEYLLGILNSTLVKFFLKECYGSLAMDGGINFSPHNVSEIPIAECDTRLEREIVSLVERIVAAKRHDARADTTAWQREIDHLVYDLYRLTPDEIKLVEESTH